ATEELKGGDVVLIAVLVGRQGCRPAEVHGAVGADEPGAGLGRERAGRKRRGGEDEESERRHEQSFHLESPPGECPVMQRRRRRHRFGSRPASLMKKRGPLSTSSRHLMKGGQLRHK